jgi:hypothetical protein
MSKEVLKIALEALEPLEFVGKRMDGGNPKIDEAITAIKEALANEALDKMAENARELGLDYEPEQPKVRTGNCLRVGVCASEGHKIAPQRIWVGLTDEEVKKIVGLDRYTDLLKEVVQYVEAKLRSKNNG